MASYTQMILDFSEHLADVRPICNSLDATIG
jgi:hypothetical protein